MKFPKSFFYTMLPYFVSFLTGIFIYCLSKYVNGNIRDLLINISASLIAITAILISYELIKSVSNRKLNQEIFEYGKMQIDREVLGIVYQLMKFFYPLEELDYSQSSVSKFLSISLKDINKLLETNTFFGFQIFRTWEAYESNLENILKNPLITEKFENDQIIAVIELLKRLRDVSDVQKIENIFLPSEDKDVKNKYRLVRGSEVNKENKNYPDRFLLLRRVKDDKYQVLDFPDIPKYHEAEALKTYKINRSLVSHLGVPMYQLTENINLWLKLTGYEFLIDTKMFKMKTITRNIS